MASGRIQITNNSHYPTREVERLVLDALGARIRNARADGGVALGDGWLTVRVDEVPYGGGHKQHRGSTTFPGKGKKQWKITAMVGLASDFPSQHREVGYSYRTENWREDLYVIVAHEAWHLRNGLSEEGATAASIRALAEYRRK